MNLVARPARSPFTHALAADDAAVRGRGVLAACGRLLEGALVVLPEGVAPACAACCERVDAAVRLLGVAS